MRTRREFLRSTALAAAGLGTAGLLGGSSRAAPAFGGTAFSGVRRAPADGTARTDAVRLVQSFGTDLYRLLAKGTGNFACSPYSIAAALAMTRNGTRGATAAEMDRVLHAPGLDRLNSGLNALQLQLASRSGVRQRGDGTSAEVRLDLANSLWGQRSEQWQPAFLDALARYYGAGMHTVDYIGDTEGARRAINGWTGQHTHGRIPELVPAGVLDPLTRLVLVNAVYLKAPWLVQFDKRATGPDAGWLGEVELGLSGPVLGSLLADFPRAEVILRLPRWTFRAQVELTDLLVALGMPTAFTDRADFSGMTLQDRLFIGAVLHEVFVAVDEEGTEAAAATAVDMQTSALSRVVRLTVDRPFLFLVHDVETGTPVFLGRVTDPSAR